MTIALLIPLVTYTTNQTLVLLENSYLNTMSVAVSSIVLLYATLSEIHQKQIAEIQEMRAQEDHTHVVKMHTMIQETLSNQQKQIQGWEFTPTQPVDSIDLNEMRPRGVTRFEKDDASDRMSVSLHHHELAEV